MKRRTVYRRRSRRSYGLHGAAALFAYLAVIRPWHLGWGSTEEEVRQPMPGDDLVPHPRLQTTRAVTIQRSPSEVWPWLVQIGYKRAGWYSYDWLESLAGVGEFASGGSANRIIPELQSLTVGDKIPAAPEPYLAFTVKQCEPPAILSLYTVINPLTGRVISPERLLPRLQLVGSWTFQLKALNGTATRMVARFRADYQPRLLLAPAIVFVLEPAHFLMERKMLLGIKQRAEQ